MERMNAVAGWGDMDFNSHMRNTAYLDKVAV
jgi:acyl-CoA thioester hydrolase